MAGNRGGLHNYTVQEGQNAMLGQAGALLTNDTSNDMDAVSAIDGVTIGRHNSATENEGFFGQVDDISIYDKVLSQAEITRNYNAGKRSHR